MHMAVIGGWATGKTALLKMFRSLAEESGCFVCELISPVTESSSVFVSTLSNTIADDLKRKGEVSRIKQITDKLQKIDNVNAFGFGAGISQASYSLSSPQFDLHIGLRTVWEHISSRYKAIVLLIDDFDIMTEDPKKLKEVMLTLRNSLMGAIDDGVKITTVVTGSDLFSKFESAHGPLIRFFEPYELTNLKFDDARLALTEPLESVQLYFTEEVIEKILKLTQGQPYYIQEFGYVLCDNASNGEVNLELFKSIYNKILHDLARKMWHQRLQIMGENSIKLIYIIAKGQNTSEGITSRAHSLFQMNKGTLRSALSRLQHTGIIYRVARGEYELSDNLFGEYIANFYSERFEEHND